MILVRLRRLALGLIVVAGAGGLACQKAPTGNDAFTYTLLRNSPGDSLMRIHVATFDAADTTMYNAVNCELARERFQSQPGVKARYWCEKGRFR
jgi:hypothetical protein